MKVTVGLMALILIFFTGCGIISSEKSYHQIDMTEAAQKMQQETDYILVDVRTEKEYAEGHIPGAINISKERIMKAQSFLDELPAPNEMVMIYCYNGSCSQDVAEKLAELGYTNVLDIGGIENWTGKIDGVE